MKHKIEWKQKVGKEMVRQKFFNKLLSKDYRDSI